MKIKLHIPTEQYGFVEIEPETDDPHAVAGIYQQFSGAFKVNEGIPDKEFDAFIQRQLLGQSNHVEEYQAMSPEQKKYVQINKRALNRIRAKDESERVDDIKNDSI